MDLEVIEKQLAGAVAEFKATSERLAALESKVADSAKASGGEADAKIAAARSETEAKFDALRAQIDGLQGEKMTALSAQLDEQKGRIAELEAAGQRPGSGRTGAEPSIGEQFGEHLKKHRDVFAQFGSGTRLGAETPPLPIKTDLLLPALQWKTVTTGDATRMVAPARGMDVDLIARRALRMRGLIPSIPTDRNSVEYLTYQGASPVSAKSVSGITRSSTTATATSTAHGYRTNDKIRIAGADQTAYNGDHRITVTGANTFTFTVSGSPTTPATGTITALKLNQFGAAAGVAEAGSKPEGAMAWALQTCNIVTQAHWIAATRQVLDDIPGLQAKIDGELSYGLGYLVDYESLWGTGTSNTLTGLMTASGTLTSAWSAGSSGDTKADALRRARTKLEKIDRFPTIAVVSPADWEAIELAKGSDGHYLWLQVWQPGDLVPRLWRMPIIVTTAMDAGSFLLMDSGAAANYYVREEAVLRFSDQHSTFFTENKVALLAEMRIGLAINNPEAIVVGSFDSAPA